MTRISFILLVAFTLFSCNNFKQTTESKPEISVSILPQEYFVSKIAGDHFKINVMIPSGASPATYEPTPAQLASISRTDLYLKIGYTGFEMAWMERLAASNADMRIINLSEGVELIMEKAVHDNQHREHKHGGVNPHTWLSPVCVKIIAQNIYKALSETYPEMEQEFSLNLDKFKTELDSLDAYISKTLNGLQSRAFFSYHPSLSYFSRDYGLEQYSLELGGKTPSAAHMKYLIDTGKKKNIRIVFLQMQFDQKNANVLADEIDAKIIQINPLALEWYEQMLLITDKLKQNLK